MTPYRFTLAMVLSLVASVSVCVAADGFGPFPTRNFQPIHQLVLGLPGDRAVVLRPGALDLRVELADTASIFSDRTPQTQVTMKFETVRSGLFLRYGLTEQLEVAVEVPVLYRYEGILGGVIEATERATTGLAPVRKALKGTGYAFNVTSNGRSVMSGSNQTVGLGDMTFMSKYLIVSETDTMPAISVRAAVKAPTGNEGQFFGSGSPDFGLGLAAEKRLGDRWMLYANVNGVAPTGRIAGFSLQPTISYLIAAEYLWSDNFSLLAHFDYYSSPLSRTDTKVFNRGISEVVAGFAYRLRPRLLWQVYGVENLDFPTGSAADFTLSTVVTYRFES
jgi:hypothetical protein